MLKGCQNSREIRLAEGKEPYDYHPLLERFQEENRGECSTLDWTGIQDTHCLVAIYDTNGTLEKVVDKK